ncbi:MAG TPA: hypothetical protein VMZ90_11465 [Vicinamibacterales bacterium]|nr:hypothetical protein [Vicinamibacterales bacterium]
MTTMTQWSRSSVLPVLTAALLMLSVGVNVMQARRIKTMVNAKAAAVSSVGRRVVPLEGFSPEGTPVLRDVARDVPTVLYYFSPTCVWCDRNWDNIRALEGGAQGRYRVVLVTRARDVRQYLSERGLALEVVEGISDTVVEAYRFNGTPQTVVASIEGVVSHEWRGAFTPRIERQLEELFGIYLPGIAAPAETLPLTSQTR